MHNNLNRADRICSPIKEYTQLFSALLLMSAIIKELIMSKKITQKRLKEVLNYNPNTGFFTWAVSKVGRKKNSMAGHQNSRGYVVIKVDYEMTDAHRLAWLYVYGYLPENDLDHIDKIKYHNWIDNLREVSRSCNMRNCGNPKNNVSGIKGVSIHKKTGKWRAEIRVNMKHKNLGYYKHFENAVCARLAAEQCLDWYRCDSSSPAYEYVKKMVRSSTYQGG